MASGTRRSRCSAARAPSGTPSPTWTTSSGASTSALPRALPCLGSSLPGAVRAQWGTGATDVRRVCQWAAARLSLPTGELPHAVGLQPAVRPVAPWACAQLVAGAFGAVSTSLLSAWMPTLRCLVTANM